MDENLKTELRPSAEIQAAHDRLVAIILREVPNPFPGLENEVRAAASVLCWVLQHDHNRTFANNLAEIDTFLRLRGFVLRDSCRLQVPEHQH